MSIPTLVQKVAEQIVLDENALQHALKMGSDAARAGRDDEAQVTEIIKHYLAACAVATLRELRAEGAIP